MQAVPRIQAGSATPLLKFDAIAAVASRHTPYPHLIASGALAMEDAPALRRDFPDIRKNGYLPLSLLKRQGTFDTLLSDLESPLLAEILSEKLGLELRDKP